MKKDFQAIGTRIGKLVQEKNEAYGDSFARCGEILRILYPNGISPEQLIDALGIARVVDKLFRIATRKDAFGESPWGDICGYGVLGVANDEAHSDSGVEAFVKSVRFTECDTDELATPEEDTPIPFTVTLPNPKKRAPKRAR